MGENRRFWEKIQSAYLGRRKGKAFLLMKSVLVRMGWNDEGKDERATLTT